MDIIKEFAQKDARIKLIQKAENRRMAGFIENLNIGLNKAKGKYIARMDADDIAHPNRFEKQVKFLEENPDIFMVGSCINLINSEGEFIKKLYFPKFHNEIQVYLPKKQSLHHPTIMFRNEKDLFYRDKMFFCEDYDLFLNLVSKGKKLHNIDDFLLNYRIHPSSISHNREQKFLQTIFVKKNEIFPFCERK